MKINFNKVNFIYNEKSNFKNHVLKNINLEFPDKKISAIVGSTGSGKSTLIQLINGLEKPKNGVINIDDKFILSTKKISKKQIKLLRKSVGIVFQFAEYQLFKDTVYKDIIFGPKNMGNLNENDLKTLANKYIKLVSLPKSYLNNSPFELSGGQKRRVAIAGILAMEPDILILDEPTAGLDPEGEAQILDIIYKLNKKHKTTIILITHNMDHVLKIADNIVVMKNGMISKQGKPIEILSDKKIVLENNLALPYIIELKQKLAKKGIDFSNNVTDLNKLVEEIISLKDRKK